MSFAVLIGTTASHMSLLPFGADSRNLSGEGVGSRFHSAPEAAGAQWGWSPEV